MKQNDGRRYILRLLTIYTALESFRHIGWMLFYEQFIDSTRQDINMGFILYSSIIMLVTVFIPLLFGQILADLKTEKFRTVFIFSVCGAFAFRVLQLFFGQIGAYVCLILWTSAIMVAIWICFVHIFQTVPRKLLGRFVGTAYCVDALIVSFVEQFTGTPAYFNSSVLVGAFLCFISILFYIRHSKTNEPNLIEEYEWKPSKRFVRSALIALMVYVLIAGAIDNLYFFDDWLELPYVGLFTLPMMSIMYLISGFLFDKLKLKITIPIALVFICFAQSVLFFAPESLFAYSYSIFSNLGTVFLQLVTVIIPIFYIRMNKNSFHFAAFGEGLFYGGFFLTSIWFLFLRQSSYRPVMGGILLAAILCLLLLIELIILYERVKHQKVIDAQNLELDILKQRVAATNIITMEELPLHEETLNIHFTKREKELMPLIISNLTAEEIARQSYLSVSTVRFHIKNILGKANVKNRRELMRIFSSESHLAENDTETQ